MEKVSTSKRALTHCSQPFSPRGCNVISCSKFLPCWLPHGDGIMSQETPFPLDCFHLHVLSLEQKMKLKHVHTCVKKLVMFSFMGVPLPWMIFIELMPALVLLCIVIFNYGIINE